MSTNDNKTRGLLGKDDIKDYVVDSCVVSPLKKGPGFPTKKGLTPLTKIFCNHTHDRGTEGPIRAEHLDICY